MEIANITVLVPYHRSAELVTNEIVPFKVYKERETFTVVPLIAREDRKMARLPEQISFDYSQRSIIASKDLPNEASYALKKIIVELQMQRLM